ncbi:MAG: 16S rRNA (cytosine(967)-C(5))-methyltransferase RsmB [Deltaproteobacteria bacterium]|nr:16S rRNA (cytosine(967)-C(5))-methyltransferase RsmB [Deltaproteobacteria bacterium]
MKHVPPRRLALSILGRLEDTSCLADRHTGDIFGRHHYLSGRDRAFIMHLVQGVLRFRLRLDWIIGHVSHVPIDRIDPLVLNILRMALYQILFMDRVPDSAAVNEAVKQVKGISRKTAGFVNGVLRQACRLKNDIPFPDRKKDLVRHLSVFYSYPVWLVHKWIRELGPDATEALLEAGNRIPSLTIRTNCLRIGRKELIERLRAEGVECMPTPYAPEGIRISGMVGPVTDINAFKQGLFQIQGEAAQLVSHLLLPAKNERILDVCAGLGGKTTHIAELTGKRGQIVSIDTNRDKLVSLLDSAWRLGTEQCVRPVVADALGTLPFFDCSFQKILVDAPCSGLGVISKHPDSKWAKSARDIRRLSELQLAILNRCAGLLSRGGTLLYVTCTISKEENEDVVQAFLDKNKDMARSESDIPQHLKRFISPDGFFRTLPYLHGMDGFFAAMFSKQK